MSEENDKASEAETAGKASLEEQKAKDAEKIAELQDAELSEDEAKAEREAREAETKAQQEADDAAEDAAQKEAQAAAEAQKEELKAQQAADDEAEAAYQEQAKKDQEARQAELQAQQDADDAAEKEFQEQAAAEQAERQKQLEEEQKAYEDEIAAAKAAADAERAAAAEDQEEYVDDSSFVADEDEIAFEETTALEDLEESWDESGFMGVYSSRTDLFNKLTSNWFSWFPPVRRFPEINFNFIVMAGLDFLGEFKSVSGIGKSLPAFEVEEGGRHHSPHYLPFKGPASREQLKLEWGSVSATSLYEWIQAVRIGWAFHRDVIVVQLSRDGWPTRIMRFGNCWPTAWSGADLDTGGSSWALQSLSLVYDDFNMITIPFDLGAWSRGE